MLKPSAARRRNRLGIARILITLALPSVVAISIGIVESSRHSSVAPNARVTLPRANPQVRASPSPLVATKTCETYAPNAAVSFGGVAVEIIRAVNGQMSTVRKNLTVPNTTC